MRLLCVLAAALLASGVPAVATAQASTDEALQRAIALYENLQVERALELLRQIVSPSSPSPVSREQRVLAHKYLGAALAILGRRDSAVVYFRSALERDPFLDLEPQRFTTQEQLAFAEARRQTFAVGLKPVPPLIFDPRVGRATFTFVTTHAAVVRVVLQSVEGPTSVVLFDRESDGAREVVWDGTRDDGGLAPPGRYELRIHGRSVLSPRSDSTAVALHLRHEFPALEDTLPQLRPDELLPEQHPSTAAAVALVKGLGLATGTILISSVVANRSLEGRQSRLALTAASLATGAGIIAFAHRRRHREITANVEENLRRHTHRDALNGVIHRRNEQRLASTRIAIGPALGSAP